MKLSIFLAYTTAGSLGRMAAGPVSRLPGMDGRIGLGWLSVGEELHNRWQVHRPNVKSNRSNNICGLCLPCRHAPEIKLHDNSLRTLVTAQL